ncbi:methylaspartate mutase subunit E [Chloroflexota bacterium]
MELRNRKWSDEEFLEERQKVLAKWPTGKEIDLDEAIEYRKRLPNGKVWNNMISKQKDGKPLFMLSMGHATVEETLEHMKFLEELGADVLIPFPDAYTRKSRYEEAQVGLEESLKQGKNMLNGYPIVNHGLKAARLIREIINIPIRCVVDCDEDPRLNAEMALASGFDTGSQDLHDLMQHSKNYPLDKRIQNNQYCSWLAGYYTRKGAPVEVQVPGNLCGWDPPGIKIALIIIQCLMTAEQGVKHLHPVISGTCNIVQDIASIKVLRDIVKEYLYGYGYDDVCMPYPVDYQGWQGSFPSDPHRASALVAWCTVIGTLGGANHIWARSIQEATGITSKESNAIGLRICQQVVNTLGRQRLPETEELRLEQEMMRLEVRALVDRVIELGDGDVAVGQLKAVERGELDAAFSPWIYLKGKVLPVRDKNGAIRYQDHGNLPLPKEVIRYHKEKIAERESAEGNKADLKMVISDITCFSKDLYIKV